MLEDVGMDPVGHIKFYDFERMLFGFMCAKDLKDRYSVLWIDDVIDYECMEEEE